jgi:hypothetical protein
VTFGTIISIRKQGGQLLLGITLEKIINFIIRILQKCKVNNIGCIMNLKSVLRITFVVAKCAFTVSSAMFSIISCVLLLIFTWHRFCTRKLFSKNSKSFSAKNMLTVRKFFSYSRYISSISFQKMLTSSLCCR